MYGPVCASAFGGRFHVGGSRVGLLRVEALHGLDDPLIDAPKRRVGERVLPRRQPLVNALVEILSDPLDGLDDGAGPALDDARAPAIGIDVLVAGWRVARWRDVFRRGRGAIAGGEERELLRVGVLLLAALLLPELLLLNQLLAERMVLLADLAQGADDAERGGFQAKGAHVGGKAQRADDRRGHGAAVDRASAVGALRIDLVRGALAQAVSAGGCVAGWGSSPCWKSAR